MQMWNIVRAVPCSARASDTLMSEVRFWPHEEIEHPNVAHSRAMCWDEGSCPFQDLNRECITSVPRRETHFGKDAQFT